MYYLGKGITNKVLNGSYKGSGKILIDAFKKYPKQEWISDIILQGFTEEEAYAKEKEIVTEDLLKDPMCLNIRLGGHGWRSAEVIENNARLWMDPAYREKMRRMKEEHWLDPGFAEKITRAASAYQKTAWLNSEYRAKMVAVSNETVKTTWKNSSFQSEMSKRAWAKTEVQELQKQKMADRWKSGPLREQHAAGCDSFWNDEERSAKLRADRSIRLKGIKWVCKDGVKKQIPIAAVEEFLALGWKRGMK